MKSDLCRAIQQTPTVTQTPRDLKGYGGHASEKKNNPIAAQVDAIQNHSIVSGANRSILDNVWELLDTVSSAERLTEGKIAASAASISKAKEWLRFLVRNSEVSRSWFDPHVAVNEDSDIVLEWWKGPRSLTVTVSPDEIWYLKAPSANMSEMEDGDADFLPNNCEIWVWLTH